MFRAVSPPIIRSSKTVNTASGMCQDCLLLSLAWLSWNSTTLAVAASNPGTYQMPCVQFLSSWWWAEKPPETCTALTIIKNITKHCILLVVLKRISLDLSIYQAFLVLKWKKVSYLKCFSRNTPTKTKINFLFYVIFFLPHTGHSRPHQ